MSKKKLIVIIGITGNQGSSVAHTFLSPPLSSHWRIRGLTRDPSSPSSLSLSSQGCEMVKVDLLDPSTLTTCFAGANLVFSVTNFWEAYFSPVRRGEAVRRGISIGRYAYEIEVAQGQNIVDALAPYARDLDQVGLVASTLCSARTLGAGRYAELWHFDGKADVFPGYLESKSEKEEAFAELRQKTSYLHTGYYYHSWRFARGWWLDNTSSPSEVLMSLPTPPDTLIPHLHPRADVGSFVSTLYHHLSPNSTLMAASEWLTWPDWIATFGAVNGVKTRYVQVSVDDMVDGGGGEGGAGREIGEMFAFSGDCGYNSTQEGTVMQWDLEKMGIHVPTTKLKEYIESVDWVEAGILPNSGTGEGSDES